METGYTLSDLLEGKKPFCEEVDSELDELTEAFDASEEGNAKLQKVIRKKIQYNDDPSTPFGYRANKKGTLEHLLTWEFPEKEDDKRKGAKSAEQIAKMQAGRKKTVKESMDEYLSNM